MRRLAFSFGMVALVSALVAPSVAHAQQSVNFFLGGFVPNSEDSRSRNNDVLVNNRDFLAFRISDFNGATVGGEWLVQLGDKFDAGLGLGFYRRTVPTVYRDYTNADRSEI